jgi:hypothetical protein
LAFVVADEPVGSHAADLVEHIVVVAAEDLVTAGPVATLDAGVLAGPAGLDEAQFGDLTTGPLAAVANVRLED